MRLTKERIKKVPIPNDPDEGFVKIRNLEADEVYRIEQKTAIFEMDGEGKQNFSFMPVEREEAFIRQSLNGWGNLFGENGEELEFNPVNVELSRRFIVCVDDKRFRFYEWLQEEREKFAKEVAKEEAAAKGN